jgi:sporulation protein YlmC with PRC-barrel domain
MTTLTRLRLIGAAALVSSAAALSAAAQTQTPAPETTPPAVKPEPAPTPPTGMKPSDAMKTPAAPSATERQSAAPAKNPMIGLNVFSSDGNKLGSVQSVDAGSDGKVRAIRLKTGGFLGFGGKLVEIPEGKFTKSGDNVQLGMSSDEVSKLPEVKNQS